MKLYTVDSVHIQVQILPVVVILLTPENVAAAREEATDVEDS